MKTIFLAFILAVCVAWTAQAADMLDHPDRQRVLIESQGQVQQVDPARHQLILQEATGKQYALTVAPDTRVLDNNNQTVPWTSLQPGDHLLVYYNTRERSALQIDIVPTLPESVLTPGHPF